MAVADRFSVPNAARALTDVAAALDAWPEMAGEAGLAGATVKKVAGDFRKV